MMKIIFVDLDQRVVVLRRGLPVRALGPGRHLLWGFGITERRWSTDSLVFEMPPALRAVLPPESFHEITLAPHERAILWRDGRPKAFLGPGVHRYWEVDDALHAQVFSVHDEMPELSAEIASII